MNLINFTFQQLAALKRKALIPYIVVGDPSLDATVRLMRTLVDAGADIIELGMPFSDPMAEGPVIQAAHERALKNSTTLFDVMHCVKKFRELDQQTPIVLMGYLNPLETIGYQQFAALAKEAEVDAVLIVDLPIEEADELLQALNQYNIYLIFLLTPTTVPERLKLICQKSNGYHYYVSLKGVTGAKQLNIADVKEKLNIIRQVSQLPIAVGFGISNAQTAAEIAKIADGIIIGSALIAKIAEATDMLQAEKAAAQLIADIRKAINN